MLAFTQELIGIAVGAGLLIAIGIVFLILKCYHRALQGSALIRTGQGGTKVSFGGMVVFPILHRLEIMDISVKRVEIERSRGDGLVCKDNMRADVKVAFFVRVNPTEEDVKKVAQSLGCRRASDPNALVDFFDAKFSEALKTVGKQFDFVELYTNRETFKEEILKVIGTDLNGYVLDDAAIDYLEQTSLNDLEPNNILDAEGIKKITDLTAKQAVLANDIAREKEKTIKKQDVEAREAILMLERQQAEAEEKQKREIAEVTAREEAQARVVQEEERLRHERQRIATDEEIAIAEENQQRQIIVALKNKQRTEAVETERVLREKQLEATERERVVSLAQIDKDKAVEVEKKNIQEVIRERVAVERTVAEEEETIKDTRAFAAANRARDVAKTKAEEDAESEKIRKVRLADAAREVAQLHAEEVRLAAEGRRAASEKDADAKKIMAEGVTAEQAAAGRAEANVMEAKAEAARKEGEVEAEVLQKRYNAEAQGITEKAEAMKLFDEVGREHEEYKLQLEQDLKLRMAEYDRDEHIASEQARLMGEALKSAKIDIVGGDGEFFDRIVHSITNGKSIDRMVDNSRALTDVKNTFFSGNGDSDHFKTQLKRFVDQFGMSSEDLKNLTVSAALSRMLSMAKSEDDQSVIGQLAQVADRMGLGRINAAAIFGKQKQN
jgi:uncharacterized membrane protein YqiK